MTDAEAKHIKKFLDRIVNGSTLPDGINRDDDSLDELATRIQDANQHIAVELRCISLEAVSLEAVSLEAVSLHRQLFGSWK